MPTHLSVGSHLDSPEQPSSPRPVHITVVEAEACHFCEAAREVIAAVARDIPIEATYIPSRSERGLALVQQHRAVMAPVVLVEGRFVSSGRLRESRLRSHLDEILASRTDA